MLYGIDVSKWQGVINWDAVKNSCDFAIMRASIGCPDAGQAASQYRDAQFSRNQSEARRVGILRAFYHFARPDVNGNRAEDEANCFCDNVGALEQGEVMILDYETDANVDQVDWCLRFLNTVYSRTGVRPLLYIDLGRNNAANWTPVVNANYGLYIARWDYNAAAAQPNTDWPFAAFRQYSNKGNVAGMNPVDLDVFYGSAEQFIKYGYQLPVVVPPPIPEPTIDWQAECAKRDITINELTTQVKTFSENQITPEHDLQIATNAVEKYKQENPVVVCPTKESIIADYLAEQAAQNQNNTSKPTIIGSIMKWVESCSIFHRKK